MTDIFIDTSYFIALTNRNDEFHKLAVEWAVKIKSEHILCHTSIPILFELGDGFSRISRREIGLKLIESIMNSSNFEIYPFSQTTHENAILIFDI